MLPRLVKLIPVIILTLSCCFTPAPIAAASWLTTQFSCQEATSNNIVFRLTITNAAYAQDRLLPVSATLGEHGNYELGYDELSLYLVYKDADTEYFTEITSAAVLPSHINDLYGQGSGITVIEARIVPRLIYGADEWATSGILTISIGDTSYTDTENSSWEFVDPTAGLPLQPATLEVSYQGNNALLSWIPGSGATETIVVRGHAGYPQDINDGELVYRGTSTSVIDPDIVTYFGTTYYRAWSVNNCGLSINYAEQTTEGNMYGVIITLGLIAIAYIKRDTVMTIIAGISLLFSGYGIIDPDIGRNAIVQALPIILMSVYMIIRAAIYATNRREV